MTDEVDPFSVRLNARLESITLGSDLTLSVLIREATHLGSPESREIQNDPLDDTINRLLAGARPIESGSGDRSIELKWVSPASFVVLDESYAGYEAPIAGPPSTALHQLKDGGFRRYLQQNSYFGLIGESATEYLLITEDAVVKIFSVEPPSAHVTAVFDHEGNLCPLTA